MMFSHYSWKCSQKKKKKKKTLNCVMTWSPSRDTLAAWHSMLSLVTCPKKNFLEPRDDMISLKCYTGKTWYATLSAIIIWGELHYEKVAIRRQCYCMKANITIKHCYQKECKVTMKANIIMRMSLGISKMWYLSRL